jgi:hypothetical protein
MPPRYHAGEFRAADQSNVQKEAPMAHNDDIFLFLLRGTLSPRPSS